jgi:hypothetical protein
MQTRCQPANMYATGSTSYVHPSWKGLQCLLRCDAVARAQHYHVSAMQSVCSVHAAYTNGKRFSTDRPIHASIKRHKYAIHEHRVILLRLHVHRSTWQRWLQAHPRQSSALWLLHQRSKMTPRSVSPLLDGDRCKDESACTCD